MNFLKKIFRLLKEDGILLVVLKTVSVGPSSREQDTRNAVYNVGSAGGSELDVKP